MIETDKSGRPAWATLGVALMTVALLGAGCGGDSSPMTAGPTGATGATGAAGPTGAGKPYDITVGQFLKDLQAQKEEILKAYAADTPSCKAKIDGGFVLRVTGQAAAEPADTRLADLLQRAC